MMRIALVVVVVAFAAPAYAQMSAVSPGKLAAPHAALEKQCNRCHVPFGGIPDAKCLGCHRGLAQRIAAGVGYHATVTQQACVDCHADHHGRDATLAPAPPASFDHSTATFPLEGKHAQLACARCHPTLAATRQWVGIASSCASCHVDREHRGALGGDCAKCHRATSWTPATKTIEQHDVPMTGGHAQLACARCHKSGTHLVAEQSCAQCHSQPHGGTKAACTTCHSTAGWQQVTYDHAFRELPGKHQTAACLSCHAGFKFNAVSDACSACHDRARPHEPLGECSDCHTALSWRSTFDHDLRFPLVGAHASASCAECHPNPGRYRGAPRACAGCHPDEHRGQLAARACSECHTSARWAPSTVTVVEHETYRMQLRDGHARAACASCHKAGAFRGTPTGCADCHADPHAGQVGRTCNDCHHIAGWRTTTITRARHTTFGFALREAHGRADCATCHPAGKLADVATDCASCHRDERHRGKLGTQCQSCHDDTGWWLVPRFDHARTGFALANGHANVACAKCHGPNGRGLVGVAAPSACATCHEPKHGDQFGSRCVDCHTTSSFRVIGFDHRTTDFPLERRHSKLPCMQCHDATKRKVITRECRSCHGDPHRGSNGFDCADCHRADRWRIVRFDHDLTAFPLAGRHRSASCGSCHTNPNWSGIRTDCVACHAFDRPRDTRHLTEVHCDDCHDETSW